MDKSREIFDLMYDAGHELDAALQGFEYLFEALFEGNKPSQNYTIDYARNQSMFWLFLDTLHKFAGKYSLMMGEDSNPRMEHEMDTLNRLHALNKWWQTPEKKKGDK